MTRKPPPPTFRNNHGFNNYCMFAYGELVWCDLSRHVNYNTLNIKTTIKARYAIVLAHITHREGRDSYYEVGFIDGSRLVVRQENLYKVGGHEFNDTRKPWRNHAIDNNGDGVGRGRKHVANNDRRRTRRGG